VCALYAPCGVRQSSSERLRARDGTEMNACHEKALLFQGPGSPNATAAKLKFRKKLP
jgi:hypothetical protein